MAPPSRRRRRGSPAWGRGAPGRRLRGRGRGASGPRPRAAPPSRTSPSPFGVEGRSLAPQRRRGGERPPPVPAGEGRPLGHAASLGVVVQPGEVGAHERGVARRGGLAQLLDPPPPAPPGGVA